YRAAKAPQPSRVLVVRSSSDWDGIEVTIEGASLPQPQVAIIEPFGNHTVPFFLWPGQYTLHVKSQGEEIYTKEIDLTQNMIKEIDLTHSGVTTRPTMTPTTTSSN
ncbi:MAG TPA: hypothetical protein VKK61_07420, partial [Tepidisphaeraceae bacterium]|nr:hypothetical protein [Tepidisphaeraceae bacterium]